MSNFLAIVDPDAARRAAFLRVATPPLALLPGLQRGEAAHGDAVVVWAAGARAPIDVHISRDGLTVRWGDVIADARGGHLRACDIAKRWHASPASAPEAFDGFHAILDVHTATGITLAGDVFGIFPLYYASDGPVLLMGSSPELFRHHPCCPARIDEEGLVGFLLAFGMLEGRTLQRGVRRLAPRRALRRSAAGAHPSLAEVPTYAISASTAMQATPLPAQIEWLDHHYAAAVARHVPAGAPIGVLLSGGRDTRLLCGYLGERAEGMHALTLGRRSDYEARCATAVARMLRMDHRIAPLRGSEMTANARLQAQWEQLGGGFSNVHMWSAIAPLATLPPRVLSGYLRESLDFRLPDDRFDAVFGSHYNRGFSPRVLASLLRPSLRALVPERETTLRDAYAASAARADERPWRFQLSHYARTHPGAVPWRLAFGAWPVLPILDRTLLDAIASVPLDTVAARGAQDSILRTRFPQLARLPLDRNDFDTTPLTPGALRRRINPALVASRRLAWRMGITAGARDRRYYYRTYDVNSVGWQRVRQAAEPFRDALSPIFDMDALRQWLPAPHLPIAQQDAIHDGFRIKTLLGLMLWASDRGPGGPVRS